MTDQPIPPMGPNGEGRMMGAKILFGLTVASSLTAGGLSVWTAQVGQGVEGFVLTRETWIPLGLVVALLVFGIGTAVRVVRYMNGNDSRFERIEDALFGHEDPSGKRHPGVVDKVDEMLDVVRRIERNGHGKEGG